MTYKPTIGASSISRDFGYTAGGNTGSYSYATEKYDDVANIWTNKTNLNTATNTAGGFSLNAYGYIAGGDTGSPSTIVEKYDDAANTWTTKTALSTGRTYLSAFSLNGYGYTAGGTTGSLSAVTEKYDDVANTWTTKTVLNTPRYASSGFSLNGYGYVSGGYTTAISATVEKYDDVANTWTIKTALNTPRYHESGFSLNGYGYTAGGYISSVSAVTERYDDVANTWTTKTVLNTAREGLAGFSPNGYGYTAGGSGSAVTEKYDDIANTWTAKANMITARISSVGFSLGALQAGVQNPEIIPIYKTINKSRTTAIWLGAEAAYLPATNPAVLNEISGSTTYAGWSYLAFDDTTAQTANWRVPISKYNGGNILVKAFSKPQITPSGAVTLQYDILATGLANDEEFNTTTITDTGINISHSLSTTTLSTELNIASATINPTNVMIDDLLIIGIRRDVASDNLVGNGQLLGILLEYTKG